MTTASRGEWGHWNDGILEANVAPVQEFRATGGHPGGYFAGAPMLPLHHTAPEPAHNTFIRGRRLEYSVTGGVIAGTALVGGVVGVVTTGTLEFDTQRQLGPLAMVGVGVIEECSKLIAPASVLLVGRYRKPADGLLLGVASGAGFAALETMGYAFVTLVQSGGNIGAVGTIRADLVIAVIGLTLLAWTAHRISHRPGSTP